MKLYNSISMATTTVLKLFGTGQITLPAKWRKKFKTKHFKAVIEDDKITISPLEEEIVIFDADEFNDGKGVELEVFYQALKKSLEK